MTTDTSLSFCRESWMEGRASHCGIRSNVVAVVAIHRTIQEFGGLVEKQSGLDQEGQGSNPRVNFEKKVFLYDSHHDAG